jgi:hypothetical protein
MYQMTRSCMGNLDSTQLKFRGKIKEIEKIILNFRLKCCCEFKKKNELCDKCYFTNKLNGQYLYQRITIMRAITVI